MKRLIVFGIMFLCISTNGVSSLPGPKVYVVTPAPRSQDAEPRSAPFYYHNWMRRMDPPTLNTTTTTTEKPKTPDLIFAEFESGNKLKSIRNLLEKERIHPKTTTTVRPIYVPDEDKTPVTLPAPFKMKDNMKKSEPDKTDYFALYNNLYNEGEAQLPVYSPSTTTPTTTTTTTSTAIPNVENIWHIIDSQKQDQNLGNWEEEPIAYDTENDGTNKYAPEEKKNEDEQSFTDNFAFPGFSTNPGNDAENESRAIRTEPNIRFPYVNLKPFQMKTQLKPVLNGLLNSKKGNTYTSLDQFHEIKNPVRGEAEDVVLMSNRQPIDRYNPAQPYLPQPTYGSKSKQSSPVSTPVRAVSNLAPPPPPPPPSITDNNFPAPANYVPFPPYAPSALSAPPPSPPMPAPILTPSISYQPPISQDDSSVDLSSFDNNEGPPLDSGYRYKPPPPPVPAFVPTAPPMIKPFSGYSYNKPPKVEDSPPNDKPEFHGYHYKKPVALDVDSSADDGKHNKPSFQGYHYDKPEPAPSDDSPPSYGHDSHSYDPEYPELVFDNNNKDVHGDDTKDVGMVPPPPQPDMKPDMDHGAPFDDSGFPNDFPGDFKYHHDFDDHDHDYHYHHTTTTTEMPRVNRYSYYYLGKKLYYLPLYFSVYFIVYVAALIIKAVLRHKIVYPNSWRPNDMTASFFTKRSIDSINNVSNEKLHEITGRISHAIAVAGEKYLTKKNE